MHEWMPFLPALLALCACASAGGASPESPRKGPARPTFDEEVAFLRRSGPVTVLKDGEGGLVAVSPKYQGRVMTSAIDPEGPSFGWINHAFIEAGRTGTAFDNYGGEDRFWLGPEGGQFGLYFAPGAPFTFASWQTPQAFNEGAWEASSPPGSENSLVLGRTVHVKNHAGTTFDVAIHRTVTVLSRAEVEGRLGFAVGPSVKMVAFETKNVITNVGREAWTEDRGLLSVWILGMYAPSADAHVLIPFDPGARGEIVNDRYFGKVPAERLVVHPDLGFLTFKCDGTYRSKIGLGPARARTVIGSYSASARLLTLVAYTRDPDATRFVNSMWEEQKEPYAGDVVNSYNDGPTEPGKPSLGGFYELETSSPAAALAPHGSLVHTHRTFHFVGPRASLDPIARRVLGVSLDDVTR